MTDTTPRIGTISMSGKEVDLTMQCNALATAGAGGSYEIALLSVAGSSSTLKSVQAALAARAKVTFKPDDISGFYSHFRLLRHEGGYRFYRHRMGYQTWHLLAVARMDGLLTESSDESLWRALMSDQITTPMLRGWVGYIKTELTGESLLRPLRCFNCTASVLSATSEEIDAIVARGIRYGHLTLEETR